MRVKITMACALPTLAVMLAYMSSPRLVQAQQILSGVATTVNGIATCDCTGAATACGCVVKGPKPLQ